MREHIDDKLARNLQNMSVWSNKKNGYILYKELPVEEKVEFDRRYPYYGYTYEEYCSMRS